MNTFVLCRAAHADLADIWEYTLDVAGIEQADAVRDSIYNAIQEILKSPRLGHQHESLRDPTLRVWRVYSYLILYWPQTSPLAISRIVHGARNLPDLDTPFP